MKPESNLNIICLESEAFYALIDKVVDHIKAEHGIEVDNYIDEYEAMKLLRITSKTTLQKYRDERRIEFTQPSKKVILYDRSSIIAYLKNHTKKSHL